MTTEAPRIRRSHHEESNLENAQGVVAMYILVRFHHRTKSQFSLSHHRYKSTPRLTTKLIRYIIHGMNRLPSIDLVQNVNGVLIVLSNNTSDFIG